MYNYIFTLATLLDSKFKFKKQCSIDTVICELFDKNLDEIHWIMALSELGLFDGFEIPEHLHGRTDLTLEQRAYELSQLPLISD
ncbi:MAG: hypothetical protein KJO59_08065 [Ignavibacteria bacterium]|nr:hypothetical protein [Ignavibacteria bacterium]